MVIGKYDMTNNYSIIHKLNESLLLTLPILHFM